MNAPPGISTARPGEPYPSPRSARTVPHSCPTLRVTIVGRPGCTDPGTESAVETAPPKCLATPTDSPTLHWALRDAGMATRMARTAVAADASGRISASPD